jgi:hypothetical protein
MFYQVFYKITQKHRKTFDRRLQIFREEKTVDSTVHNIISFSICR